MLAAVIALAFCAEPKLPDLKALLVTGGCCHDYETQKLIITEGTSARARIQWVVVHQGGTATSSKIPLYEKADWYKGFDIVVHNECFSDAKDPKWTETIVKPHRDGLPGVLIHCGMHCYRDGTGEWFKFCGVTSHRHGAHYPFEVVPTQAEGKDHPILAKFPGTWKTPKGELYQVVAQGDKCVPLATAKSRETKKDEVCVWTNTFGKGRVFGTTIGHYNEELADPVFLDMLTRGMLWACDKPVDAYLKPFDASKTKFRWEKSAETKEPPKAGSKDGK
jgi:type 1 glutamine amidotransferase